MPLTMDLRAVGVAAATVARAIAPVPRARYLPLAFAATLLAICPPAAADPRPMTLGGIVRTALPGCDNPTPVRASPGGPVYSNVSDCAVGARGRVSTGWVRLDRADGWVPSNLTTLGDGRRGRKLSGALVDDGRLYLLERNLTASGGMRVGRSAGVARPDVTWIASFGFGWGSFAQRSPNDHQYIYFRDAPTAYGGADRVVLARVLKGRVGDLGAWEVFAGSPAAPAWVPWANRAARRPVLSDPGRVNRVHVSHLGGCWRMAVTMPPRPGVRGGDGLAVYTSDRPYGPWSRRYRVAGRNLGESAQFSPFWPGRILLTEGDRFVWRSYAMPSGC